MQLRSGNKTDIQEFTAIHAASLPDAWDEMDFASFLAQSGVFCYVAEKQDKGIGFILCRVAAHEAEILTFAVLPQYRRAGTGRNLLHAALAEAQLRAARAAFLEVAVDNAAALALYREAGFKEVGRRAKYYVNGQDALVLRQDLS